jgi:hypothetical protein
MVQSARIHAQQYLHTVLEAENLLQRRELLVAVDLLDGGVANVERLALQRVHAVVVATHHAQAAAARRQGGIAGMCGRRTILRT